MHAFTQTIPLFGLILVGYLLVLFLQKGLHAEGTAKTLARRFTQFVFNFALPLSLFRLMSGLAHLPAVDSRLLLAFFGSCIIVFALGRLVAWKCFKLDGVSQSVFAQGGVFSNNLLLGTPLAQAAIGDAAMPAVALVLIFNGLILWSLITVNIEWARHGSLSPKGFLRTAWSVMTNPVIVGIVCGMAAGYVDLKLPLWVDQPLRWCGQLGMPMALVALGMGLAEYGLGGHWPLSLSMTVLKLVVQPLCVYIIAWLMELPILETQVVVLLASVGIGANVYIMSRQFNKLEAAVANGLIVSTALSAITAPLALALVRWAHA